MATTIEIQGHTVDEAIQIALNQLGVSRDKVEIEILHHPRRGVLGIGARRAKVRATIRESVMLDGEEFDMSGGGALDDKPRRRRRRGGRNRGGGRGEDSAEVATEAAPRAAGGGREPGRGDGDRRGSGRRGDDSGRSREDRNRGGGRGRGDQRGDRPGGPEAQQRGPEQQRESGRQESRDRSPQRGRQSPKDQPGRRDPGRSGVRGRGEVAGEAAPVQDVSASRSDSPAAMPGTGTAPESRAASPVGARRPPAAEEAPLDAAALDEIRTRAEVLVRELLQKMGFAAEVTSSIDETAGEAMISVRSESEGLLIGRRGQTLDSLEHIVNRMALRGDAYVEGRVLLDIGDYRKRRRESLEELAARLRNRAVGERRTVQVSPMSPRDRKFFAQAFADDDSVEVRALGAGFYRRVIVAPAGMGAAAVAAAEAAGGGEDEAVEVETGFAGAEAER